MTKLACVLIGCFAINVSAIMKLSLKKTVFLNRSVSESVDTSDVEPQPDKNDTARSEFVPLEPHGPVTQKQLDTLTSTCTGISLKDLSNMWEAANNSVDAVLTECKTGNSDRSLLSSREAADTTGQKIYLACFGKGPTCGYYWESGCPAGYSKFNANAGGMQYYGGSSVDCGEPCWSGWKLGCYNYVPDGYQWIGTAPECDAGYDAACFEFGLASTGKTATSAPVGREYQFGSSCLNGDGKAECMDPSNNGRVPYANKGTVFNGNIIRVAFWNIFAREQLIVHDGQYERVLNIGAKVKEFANGEVDVIVFDEAWAIWNEFYTELERSGFMYFCSSAGTNVKTTEPTGGTMLASKFAFTSCNHFKYYQGKILQYPYGDEDANDGRACAGKDCWKSKGIVSGHVTKCTNCQKYLIVGTHLQANYAKSERDSWYGRFHSHRKIQATNFAGAVSSWATDQYDAVIFAGDFNSDWIKISHRFETQELMGLMDITPIVPNAKNNRNPDCTYCTTNDLVQKDYKDLLKGEYLDYIGYGNLNKKPNAASIEQPLAYNRFKTDLYDFDKIYVCGATLIPSFVSGNQPDCSAPFYTRDLSDHHPVVATFAYNGASLPSGMTNELPATTSYVPSAGDKIQIKQAVYHSGAYLGFSENKQNRGCEAEVGPTKNYVGGFTPGSAGDDTEWEVVQADVANSYHLKNVKYGNFLGSCGSPGSACDRASYSLHGFKRKGARTLLTFVTGHSGHTRIIMNGRPEATQYVGMCGVGSQPGFKYDVFGYDGTAYDEMTHPDRNDWTVIKLN